MPQDERFLPRHITRFILAILRAKATAPMAPAVQRGEYPEVAWSARPGHTAAHRHIQQDFQLLLHATATIWRNEVFPRFRELADIRNRQMYALEYYVEHDKVEARPGGAAGESSYHHGGEWPFNS
jgi:hypothetical protein